MVRKLALTLSLLFSLNVYAQTEKLIFAVDVIRHGDRSAIHSLPKAPFDWPQGLGQLTPKGMQQEFKLGAAKRKRYVEQEGLLPARYQAKTIYVRASDFDRTLMSAESFLMGLYPLGTGPALDNNMPALPSGYQAIPIHTVPQDQDTLLVLEANPFKELIQKYVLTRADWKKKNAELQPQFAHWSEVTGIQITELYQLISLGDTLLVRKIYNLPLPNGMTAEDETQLIEARDWAFSTLFKDPIMGQETGGKLLALINEYLLKASQHQTELKYVLFSAHDSTILSLMSALKLPMEHSPPYASNLNFALYETASGGHLVKISLNGEDLVLPGCGKTQCRYSLRML